MILKIIALAVIALLLVADYAMLVVASKADEEAEKMRRAWKNERSDKEK